MMPHYHLKRLHIDAFGGLHEYDAGPFAPGLNVVFGRNEAGKTTLSTFIASVLFGWPDARGARNTYRPVAGERSGSVLFERDDSSADDAKDESSLRSGKHGRREQLPQTITCERARNARGIKPDPHPYVINDIDEDTFDSLFALDSDELRSLGKTNDLTSRLLTAGAGTKVSPAEALSHLNDRIATFTSRSAQYPNSIPNLRSELKRVRNELQAASDEAELFRHESREYADLVLRRSSTSASLEELNRRIETLSNQREVLNHLAHQQSECKEQRATAQEKYDRLLRDYHRSYPEIDAEDSALSCVPETVGKHSLDADSTSSNISVRTSNSTGSGAPIRPVDAVEEQTIRDTIDERMDTRVRLEHALALAQRDCAASRAAYETLEHADDTKAMRLRVARQRRTQIILSVVLPLIFIVVGVPVFIRGREIASLSVSALGVMLVCIAILMACAAIAMLFRPDKRAEALHQRLQDAQWVMVQDQKKQEVCEKDLADQETDMRSFLASSGLGAAQGSLHRARALLDQAHDRRSERELLEQRLHALSSQIAEIDDRIKHTVEDRNRAFSLIGEPEGIAQADLDDMIARVEQQRAAQVTTGESINARYGELKQHLASARHMHAFDQLKNEQAELRARYDDTIETYASLLLARRLLRASIATWESKSQPHVYREASRLLALMTDGAWSQVRIGSNGMIEVVDANERTRTPSLLSLGTCQQLYLSLRIALLLTAQNVGRNVPILADDILVNFDAQRRRGAAMALKELSNHRQVIIFTCHEEIVRLMQDCAPGLNTVEL